MAPFARIPERGEQPGQPGEAEESEGRLAAPSEKIPSEPSGQNEARPLKEGIVRNVRD